MITHVSNVFQCYLMCSMQRFPNQGRPKVVPHPCLANLTRCPLDSPSAQDFGDPHASGPPSGQTLGAVKEQKFEWNLAKEQAGAFF
jgi:hypothetical protein